LSRNWKTKVCEIDIVAKKDKIIYFVEVKYRRQAAQGDGFEYITDHKLNRMTFAADIWCQNMGWNGDCRMMAAAVSGPDSESIELIELG
jgi:Holliday junction resolvase-like predicted endonuclease